MLHARLITTPTPKAKRGQEELAIYTSLKVNAFSKNELATIRFLGNVPNEEKVFLILALMFHDFQLPPVAEPKVRCREQCIDEVLKLVESLSNKQQAKRALVLQRLLLQTWLPTQWRTVVSCNETKLSSEYIR